MTANQTREAVAKALVWTEGDCLGDPMFTASGYVIDDEGEQYPDGRFHLTFGADVSHSAHLDTLELAKAAAQAHHESRIRSALADHVLPEAGDGRLSSYLKPDKVTCILSRDGQYEHEVWELDEADFRWRLERDAEDEAAIEQQLARLQAELDANVQAKLALMKRDGEARTAITGLLVALDLAPYRRGPYIKAARAFLADLPANEGEKL